MELKKYQQSAVDTLKEYLKELQKVGTKYAFMGITNKPYNPDFFGEIPFVCVKIPTGGGKTMVACHATQEIMKIALANKLDRGIVMWFVPSEAIKTQTLRKFKDKNDFLILSHTCDPETDSAIVRRPALPGSAGLRSPR